MIYILHKKQSNELIALGSLVALCKVTGLNINIFYHHFGRNKHTEYENNFIRIVKTDIIRSTGN
jgi:hypothetical protein